MRVLLVEDDELVQRLFATALRAAGFAVRCSTGICDAMRILETATFDAVVLDRGLPDGDGLSVCRSRRALGDRTRFVICSGLVATSDVIAGYGAGAELYLKKPLTGAELAAHVAAFVSRGRCIVGPVTIDRVSGVLVFASGGSIQLAPQERVFLDELIDAGGRPVSRDQLALAIWQGEESDGNGLDVLALRLRRKLGDHAALVRTVRGVGYKIVLQPRETATGAEAG
jgi:DNA-binding response OmpR family regulator